MPTPIEQYEALLKESRIKFSSRVQGLMQNAAPEELLLFLIHYCSQGVGMTQPVEGWINRAGSACLEQGYGDIGRALLDHAKHEKNHHLLMIKDTHSLVKWLNRRNKLNVKAEDFLSQPFITSVQAYRKLHENYIAGQMPYCQIAIEYEVEQIAVLFGPSFIKYCLKKLGLKVLVNLRFIRKHIILDQGHTKYNKRQLNLFAETHPQALLHLVQAGQDALNTYSAFLQSCSDMALASKQDLKLYPIKMKIG